PGELFRDQGEGRARRLADAQREVAGLAAHGRHEVPARGGLGVHHQVLDDVHPHVARGLEPEGVDGGGQVEVVVDGLGDVDDAQAEQREHGVLEVLGVGGGVGAGDPDLRTAAEVDPAHVLDGQGGDVLDVALHDPLEAVADAQDGHAVERATDGGGADDAVDAG